MFLVSEARASIKALEARNNLHYLFEETLYDDVPVPGRPTEESSHGKATEGKHNISCYQLSSLRISSCRPFW